MKTKRIDLDTEKAVRRFLDLIAGRYDVAGAQRVGMKGIWKRVEGRPPEADDHSVTPDAVITHIGELPAALDRLYAPPTGPA